MQKQQQKLKGQEVQQSFSWTSSPLMMGPRRCPEMSVNHYHTTARTMPEERKPQYTHQLVPTAQRT
jgi:hypothetical protein